MFCNEYLKYLQRFTSFIFIELDTFLNLINYLYIFPEYESLFPDHVTKL